MGEGKVMLDPEQVQKLKDAFWQTRGSDGAAWTWGKIDRFVESGLIAQVLDVIEGRATIVPVQVVPTPAPVAPL